LDIEVSFKSLERNKSQDRIDILLYDTKKQILKFVEVKHFTNSEIRSIPTPKVIKQIDKYKKQIAKKETEIIKAYENYITAINEIFELKLPPPKEVDSEVTLLIFGFDKDQKQGRLKKTEKRLKKFDIFCKSIGSTENITQETLQKYKK
jgi:hypothetical protein